jgi:aryl-alcohol dehydrogenase-like predicted oxidoreductase
MDYRPLADTGLEVSVVSLGCWPIAGMTSLDVNEADSLATLEAALDCGINSFDTAYCYGRDGESERLIARALAGRRERAVIATKAGIQWGPDGKQQRDGRPETLQAHCEISLRRLNTDYVDLFYLHAPDPQVPVAESAGAIAELIREGKVRAAGASNCTVAQLEAFAAACPLAAVQPCYNMLQREIEADVLPWCGARGVAVFPYWPLLKGLLAGKLARDHVFAPGDGRAKYPMFQGEEWQRNQDLIDELRSIAGRLGKTVAQLVLRWTLSQPGITSVLCGAKRAAQVRENAGAGGWELAAEEVEAIEAALRRRGRPVTRTAV